MPLYSHLFFDPDVSVRFADAARLQTMLDVEVALAEAEADAGVIPASAVAAIRAAGRAEEFDLDVLAREARDAGNVVIPLVRHLTIRVSALDPAAADSVHVGATSQDVIDTALVLQLRAGLVPLAAQVRRAAAAAARHAREHRSTPIAGRTWLQQATPTTFGAKAAGWLEALERGRLAVEERGRASCVLQFGGASGTLAALGPAADEVSRRLGERLALQVPDIPWHGHRDRLVRLACALAVLTGTLGKIARDLALLAQTEVGEAFEAPAEGRGGSSSMPHKQNPVSSAVALAAAVRVPGLVASLLAGMPQEHERGLGGWQAEWEAVPEVLLLTSGAARSIADALDSLVVDRSRMAANLAGTHGLTLSESVAIRLAPQLGRRNAQAIVQQACRAAIESRRPLVDVLAQDARVTQALPAEVIRQELLPARYLGRAEAFVDRVLARWDAAGA